MNINTDTHYLFRMMTLQNMEDEDKHKYTILIQHMEDEYKERYTLLIQDDKHGR